MNRCENENKLFMYGSTWIRADFHLHTRKDKEFKYSGEDNHFITEYVQKMKEQNIRVGVITNHNKFDMDEFKALRKAAKKENIFLLPGVELSVNDGSNGIHTLIVFHEEWIDKNSVNYIEQFIAGAFAGKSPAEYEQENQRSNDNLLTTIERLENFHKDFFLVFAHVENNKGLWAELNAGRITEIGKGSSCYIKIGDFTFDAVKFALKDCLNHVTDEMKKYNHSYVKSIAFEGGKLDKQTIFLSPELNTLIGIRGSGKSSVLEVLRYTLGISFDDKTSDRKYKEELVGHILGSGGKVVVNAVDRRGMEYEIRRIWKEQSDVYVNGTLRPGVSIRETVLNKPIYFGQKDLSSSGEGFERILIEKLLGEQLGTIRLQIEEQKQKVKIAAEQLKKLTAVDENIEEYKAKQQDAEFKLSIFKKHGVEEKLQKQLDFDTDTRYFQQTEEKIEEFLRSIEDICNQHEDELRNQQWYRSKQNETFLTVYLEQYQQLIAIYEQIKENSQKGKDIFLLLQGKAKEFEQLKYGFKEDFAQIERQLAEELRISGTTAIRPEEYRELSTKIGQAKAMLATLEKQKQQSHQRKEELLHELAILNDLWHQEYTQATAILQTVNDRNPSLQLTVTYKTNKHVWFQYLDSMVKGSGIRKQKLQAVLEQYIDFGTLYQEMENVIAEFGSSGVVFEEIFMKNIGDFLTWQVPNDYLIKYRGKELKHHSMGQRASALILFVLSQEDNDVFIIDQPEDDLDNQTIYEDVIKLIRQLKQKTQFIFATHNANFPVLGDAEQVLACEYTQDAIAIKAGSIDVHDIQHKIVSIMEGGKDAFHRRKEIYDVWTRQNY